MTAEKLRIIEEPVNSTEIERFYALDSILRGVDDFFKAPTFLKNNFVQRILELLSNEPNGAKGTKDKIAIDFSSPNIAKPFHVGHLRSTNIGRAVSNLAISNGADVVRINYLGDWGTQFGLLAIGNDSFGDDQNLPISTNLSRMRKYFDIYVKANERAETDPEFRRKAIDYFARLETGSANPAEFQFWRRVTEESVQDLKMLYSRLNVEFDVWESEHAAASPAKLLVEDCLKRNLLERTEDNLIGVRVGNEPRVRFLPLAKSDGTTLYLTRDIYSALHRFDDLSCRKLIYVVDRSQTMHFIDLKDALVKIGRGDVAEKIVHAKFGRVRGMSTRKGIAVFVDDILDEGAKRAEEDVLKPDIHTKALPGTLERQIVGEQLTLSCMIVNDLRHELAEGYKFDWKRILETKMDGGVALQKTFCRLSSICEQCQNPSVDIDTFRQSMIEKQALDIIGHVTRNLAPAWQRSLNDLELNPLTEHLFQLRRMCGAAVRGLRVVDAPSPALKSSRFLLFNVARRILGLGIRLLGAKPLAKI